MLQINFKHSLVDTETIKQMTAEYDLGDFIQCDLLARSLNDTYFITDDEHRYIFRLYRSGWRDKQKILFELDTLVRLYDRGFAASYPVRKKDGLFLNEIDAPEGLRYGVLFSYSEGKRPQINADNSEMIGATLGRLHKLTTEFSVKYDRGFELDTEHLLDEPAAFISPVIERYLGTGAVEILNIVVENTKADLAELDLEKGFCHEDFHNHNMHIHDGEIEVFDFDCCAFGYRGYDIAVSWWNLKNNYKNMEEACWDAFLKGYLAERDLAADDVRSLPLFITARRIWLMGTMLANDDVWGTNWINLQTLKLFIGQLRTDRLGDEDLRERDGDIE
ncbi:Ser/Thr protein kinase RdoA involved in Cpx stress response, MazF antagonist [Lentibacillus halodurans]|uniref:Ser/Thr protein kinase RdoA involved in Cpx stress response, MazF antagonist n=1 Tax=Lentibacillus halodurans TaxID=237679 RepID=A0A1I0Z880_9BACI|nr:phosphotransferase [Lentibacillus halodurans]SFB21316.1 Ser/Thr protein kinase RdoA involved in Cpx stress response, MazF antagonist [Lentibacillus halodurans]